MGGAPALDASGWSSLQLLKAGQNELGIVAHRLLIWGTNSENEFSFKGASIIMLGGDQIRSDECYFDPQGVR
jgi:hypothetical protein